MILQGLMDGFPAMMILEACNEDFARLATMMLQGLMAGLPAMIATTRPRRTVTRSGCQMRGEKEESLMQQSTNRACGAAVA